MAGWGVGTELQPVVILKKRERTGRKYIINFVLTGDYNFSEMEQKQLFLA